MFAGNKSTACKNGWSITPPYQVKPSKAFTCQFQSAFILDILHGNKVIEIKSSLTNKGKFISRYLEKNHFDFILAVGDDVTDEDMFKILTGENHFTIKVGLGNTAARYNLVGVNNVLTFLDQLCSFREPLRV